MPDDFPVRKACVDPPHVDFNVWDEEKLPLFVNGTLDDLIPHTDYGVLCGAVLRLACDFFLVDPDIDILAVAGMGNIPGFVFFHLKPVFPAFPLEITLDDEIASPL